MDKTNQNHPIVDERVAEYEYCLLEKYGVVVGGEDLRRILGYRNSSTFRMAVMKNNIPFPTFMCKERRMRMARTHDIAIWLASIDADLDDFSQK